MPPKKASIGKKVSKEKFAQNKLQNALWEKYIAETQHRALHHGAVARGEKVEEKPKTEKQQSMERKISEDFLRELANAPKPKWEEDEDED
jgi:hypothetical protein